jgi:aryl-alcohol dehydrogenase-like predicted oxidoreductase
MAMKQRQVGRSGLMVGPLMFGGNVFGWTADETASFKLLDAFVASGLNFVDTADVYSTWVPEHKGGESETTIGRWFKASGKRDKIVLATKVGSPMSPTEKGLSKAYILQAVEKSLQRLQTDYIDLYQAHRDDPDTPQDETMEAFATLMKQGKVRVLGASNFTADRLAGALEVSRKNGYPRYECLQPQYNLYDREGFEKELEPLCMKEGLGVISYYSLASGFLTGKYRSEADLTKSQRGAKVKNYLNERGSRILKALDEVAEQTGESPATVALAWLIARPSITAPITSATSVEQLWELVAATELELDKAAIENLDQASAW